MTTELITVAASATTGIVGWASGRIASRSNVIDAFLEGFSGGQPHGLREGHSAGFDAGQPEPERVALARRGRRRGHALGAPEAQHPVEADEDHNWLGR